MNRFLKSALLGTVALGVLSSVAIAADLPSRKAPVAYLEPVPVFTWTGFYVGLNAGVALRNNTTYTSAPFFVGNSSNNSNAAFVGGGQVGYNWQNGAVVFGLEADAQYRSAFANNNNNGFFGGNSSNNGGYLGTVRGRVGYLFTPALLAYATGGLAYGTSYYNTPAVFFGGNNNNNSFRVGYAVGGGLEYLVTPNWSLKAEYLWTDLGRSNNNNGVFGFGVNTPRSQAHVIRAGINYHFNWASAAPVVAKY
jgi:outer membrane immunogenic protein